jgi:hypothetical protein
MEEYTPQEWFYPTHATLEQQEYADGFMKALAKVHQREGKYDI